MAYYGSQDLLVVYMGNLRNKMVVFQDLRDLEGRWR